MYVHGRIQTLTPNTHAGEMRARAHMKTHVKTHTHTNSHADGSADRRPARPRSNARASAFVPTGDRILSVVLVQNESDALPSARAANDANARPPESKGAGSVSIPPSDRMATSNPRMHSPLALCVCANVLRLFGAARDQTHHQMVLYIPTKMVLEFY